MKVGDKVILKKFEDDTLVDDVALSWHDSLEKYIGKEVEVVEVDDNDGSFAFEDYIWWMQDACEPVNKARYFLVSYSFNNGEGSFYFEHRKFPSYLELKKAGRELSKKEDVVIINIFEFQSEQDYLDFTSDEEI